MKKILDRMDFDGCLDGCPCPFQGSNRGLLNPVMKIIYSTHSEIQAIKRANSDNFILHFRGQARLISITTFSMV